MSYYKKYLQAVYAVWSQIYDTVLNSLFYFDRQQVIDALHIKKGNRVLELGVGTGLNLQWYPPWCTVYGVDFSAAMLAKARLKKASAKVVLVNADASRLKFTKAFFNKALMTYVLRVAPSPRVMLKEIARVLKHGGTLLILDQFKTKSSYSFLQSLKLALGWGKDYELKKLINGLPFTIQSTTQFGKMHNTLLVELKRK